MSETLTRLEPSNATAQTRYQDDLYTWVEEQVALLKAGRIHELDLANIAEELQDVGSEQYHQLESAFRVLLMHMLKWDQQPERKSKSWEASIDEQRERITKLLRKNPGLDRGWKRRSRTASRGRAPIGRGRDRAAAEGLPGGLPLNMGRHDASRLHARCGELTR